MSEQRYIVIDEYRFHVEGVVGYVVAGSRIEAGMIIAGLDGLPVFSELLSWEEAKDGETVRQNHKRMGKDWPIAFEIVFHVQ